MSAPELVDIPPSAPKAPVVARPIQQPIHVRATWKAGEKSCNLLVGKSNVLVSEYVSADGKKQPSDPHLPGNHAFFWSAVEVIEAAENVRFSDRRFLRGSDFVFKFGLVTEFMRISGALVLNRKHRVSLKGEEYGQQAMDMGKMLSAIPAILSQQNEPGDEWKEGEGEDEADQPSMGAMHDEFMNGVTSAFSNDPRTEKPIQVSAYECITAELVSDDAPHEDINLIFVMHGVLLRPIPTNEQGIPAPGAL